MRGSVRVVVGLALAARLAGAEAPPSAAGAPNVIQYHDDRLTVRIHEATIDDVLAAIAGEAGAEIRGRPKDAHTVSIEFEDVPMSEAMHRLLGDQNFTLIYGEQGRLKAIRLHGGPQGPPIAAAAATEPVQRRKSGIFHIVGILDQHPPVPVSGRLSEVLNGATEASFRELFQVAAHQNDPALRMEATRTALNAIESDPSLRDAVVVGLAGTTDGSLRRLVHLTAGDRADEMLTNVLGVARASEIRAKAATLLQKQSAQAGGAAAE